MTINADDHCVIKVFAKINNQNQGKASLMFEGMGSQSV